MTADQWNEYGYQVFSEAGHIHLVRPHLKVGYTAPEEFGRWVNYHNPNRPPWRFINYRQHPHLMQKFCEPSEKNDG